MSNLLFTSCYNLDWPSVVIDEDSIGCFPGDTAIVGIKAGFSTGFTTAIIERLQVQMVYDGSPIMIKDTGFKSQPIGHYSGDLPIKVPYGITKNLYLIVTAIADNGKKASGIVTIFPSFETKNFWLGAGANSIYPEFISTRLSKGIYASEAVSVSEDIDMCYYYDSFFKGCVYSPSDPGFGDLNIEGTNQKSWPYHKATTFRSFQNNKIDFLPALYTPHGIQALYQSGTLESTYIHHITEYKRYLFRTEDGQFGVVGVYPIVKGVKGYASVSIILQK